MNPEILTETDQFVDLWPAPHSCHMLGRCCAFWQTPVHPLTCELPQQQPVNIVLNYYLLEQVALLSLEVPIMIFIDAVHNPVLILRLHADFWQYLLKYMDSLLPY